MAKAATKEAPTSQREILTGDRPSHLMKLGGGAGGPGRSRIPTEFDDSVLSWYESKEWIGIPASGNDDAEKALDFEEIFKAVKRAADHHQLGLERVKDEENYVVWVNVRDKQSRGPVPGSIKDPETGKMVKPDDPRYEDVKAARANGATSAPSNDSTDDSPEF